MRITPRDGNQKAGKRMRDGMRGELGAPATGKVKGSHRPHGGSGWGRKIAQVASRGRERKMVRGGCHGWGKGKLHRRGN